MIKFETSKIDIFLTLTTIINWSGLNGHKRFLIGFMTKIFANSEGRVTLPNRKNFRKIGKGGGVIFNPKIYVAGFGNSKHGWSGARGRTLQMIGCKRKDPLDYHLQVAGLSTWSFARGCFFQMIICKRRILRMIIWGRPDPLDDQLQEAGSSCNNNNNRGDRGGVTRVTGVGKEGGEEGKEGRMRRRNSCTWTDGRTDQSKVVQEVRKWGRGRRPFGIFPNIHPIW